MHNGFMLANEPKKDVQVSSCEAYWPAVQLSETTVLKMRDCEILYAHFRIAFQRTLAAVLEQQRTSPSTSRINVADIITEGDVPAGLRFSYRMSDQLITIVDLWTPPQPSLFGVQRS